MTKGVPDTFNIFFFPTQYMWQKMGWREKEKGWGEKEKEKKKTWKSKHYRAQHYHLIAVACRL